MPPQPGMPGLPPKPRGQTAIGCTADGAAAASMPPKPGGQTAGGPAGGAHPAGHMSAVMRGWSNEHNRTALRPMQGRRLVLLYSILGRNNDGLLVCVVASVADLADVADVACVAGVVGGVLWKRCKNSWVDDDE